MAAQVAAAAAVATAVAAAVHRHIVAQARADGGRRQPATVLVLGREGCGRVEALRQLFGVAARHEDGAVEGRSRALFVHPPASISSGPPIQVVEAPPITSAADIASIRDDLPGTCSDAIAVILVLERRGVAPEPAFLHALTALFGVGFWRRAVIALTSHNEEPQDAIEEVERMQAAVADAIGESIIMPIPPVVPVGSGTADTASPVVARLLLDGRSWKVTRLQESAVSHFDALDDFDDLATIMDDNVESANLAFLADNQLHRPARPPPVASPAAPSLNFGTGGSSGASATATCRSWSQPLSAPATSGPPPAAASLTMSLAPMRLAVMAQEIIRKADPAARPQAKPGLWPVQAPGGDSATSPASRLRTLASSAVGLATDAGTAQEAHAACDGSLASASRLGRSMGSPAPAFFPDLVGLRASGHSAGPPRLVGGLRNCIIVWFRNDLRLHDNEALLRANQDGATVLPVYFFDPRDYGIASSGFDRTGPYRAKFIRECVKDLRASLRERGSDLVVRFGRPETLLPELASQVGAEAVYGHQEVTYEEIQTEEQVAAILKKKGVETQLFWGNTLYHIDDLPVKLRGLPSTFGGFREQMRTVAVRGTTGVSERLKTLPVRGAVDAGDVPSLQQLGLSPGSLASLPQDALGCGQVLGGETEALARLRAFVEDTPAASGGATATSSAGVPAGSRTEVPLSRDFVCGANFLGKMSPWLATGCLSARRLYEDLKRSRPAARQSPAQEHAHLSWLVFELQWRDFFRFLTKKAGSAKGEAERALRLAPAGEQGTRTPSLAVA